MFQLVPAGVATANQNGCLVGSRPLIFSSLFLKCHLCLFMTHVHTQPSLRSRTLKEQLWCDLIGGEEPQDPQCQSQSPSRSGSSPTCNSQYVVSKIKTTRKKCMFLLDTVDFMQLLIHFSMFKFSFFHFWTGHH